MRKLRLINVVAPEVVAYFSQGSKGSEAPEPEYNCTCVMGVAKEYKCCPYCGAEFVWDKVVQPSKEFRKLFDRL